MSEQLDQQCVNTLRFLSVDMVQQAESGQHGEECTADFGERRPRQGGTMSMS